MKARAAQTASASPHRVLMTTNSHIFPLFFILHAMFEWYYQSCQFGYLFFSMVIFRTLMLSLNGTTNPANSAILLRFCRFSVPVRGSFLVYTVV